MKPTPLQVARSLWDGGEYAQAIRIVQAALHPAQLGPWLAGIVECAAAIAAPLPEPVIALLAVAQDPERWREGHDVFDRLRRLNLAHDRKGEASALLHLAELCASIFYNLSRQPRPFDEEIFPALAHVLSHFVRAVESPLDRGRLGEAVLRLDAGRRGPSEPSNRGPAIAALALTAKGLVCATGGVLVLRDRKTGALKRRMIPALAAGQARESLQALHTTGVAAFPFFLVSAGTDGRLRGWDLTRDMATFIARWSDAAITSLSLTAKRPQKLLACVPEERALLWTELPRWEPHALRLEAEGGRVGPALWIDEVHAVVGRTGHAELWNVDTGQREELLRHHDPTERLTALAVSLRGQWIATAGERGTIVTWAFDSKRQNALFSAADDGPVRIGALLFSPNGRVLFAGCDDGEVRVFNPTGDRLMQLHAGARVNALALDRDALYAGDALGRVTVWNWHTGKRLRVLDAIPADADPVPS